MALGEDSNMIIVAIDTLNRSLRNVHDCTVKPPTKTRGEYNKQLNGTSRTHHRSSKSYSLTGKR